MASCGFREVLSLISSGSTFSPFFSDSFVSDLSSLHILGRGSRVLPLVMRFVSPSETLSFSSFLMTSCLKEKADIMWGLDVAFGGSTPGLAASGALSDSGVGMVTSSSSVGRTFLTTRRTTFTTFLRVEPWSSAESIWLVLEPGILG